MIGKPWRDLPGPDEGGYTPFTLPNCARCGELLLKNEKEYCEMCSRWRRTFYKPRPACEPEKPDEDTSIWKRIFK